MRAPKSGRLADSWRWWEFHGAAELRLQFDNYAIPRRIDTPHATVCRWIFDARGAAAAAMCVVPKMLNASQNCTCRALETFPIL
jgi:hypothetical protein